MKAILCLFIVCGMMSCQTNTSQTANTQSADSTAIIAVLDQQVRDWNNGSIDGFMQGYWHNADLKFIGKNGTRFNYDSVAANYKRHYHSAEKMGKLSFEDLSVFKLADQPKTYQVTGKWQIVSNQNSGGYFSLIFQEQSKAWKIVVDHTW
ncbi:MAG: hypothetical protein RLZZ318_1087 [Bacteroidota bacterium]|jgi:hypothetical protein